MTHTPSPDDMRAVLAHLRTFTTATVSLAPKPDEREAVRQTAAFLRRVALSAQTLLDIVPQIAADGVFPPHVTMANLDAIETVRASSARFADELEQSLATLTAMLGVDSDMFERHHVLLRLLDDAEADLTL